MIRKEKEKKAKEEQKKKKKKKKKEKEKKGKEKQKMPTNEQTQLYKPSRVDAPRCQLISRVTPSQSRIYCFQVSTYVDEPLF